MATINEFIEALNSKAKLEKERAFYDAVRWNRITEYGAYCKKLESECRQLAELLKELQTHREAWAKVEAGIKDYISIYEYDFDEFQNGRALGAENVLDIIERYKPKED